MQVCGVEIKGTEAVISLLSNHGGLINIPECRVRKIEYTKKNTTSDLIYFQSTFAKLIEDYKIDAVVIKERPLKGKFAGGALGFKMEAAIQLIPDLNVQVMSNIELKEILNHNPILIDFSETGLKIFQQQAFNVAFAFLSSNNEK
jgi:hypothetical protein